MRNKLRELATWPARDAPCTVRNAVARRTKALHGVKSYLKELGNIKAFIMETRWKTHIMDHWLVLGVSGNWLPINDGSC